MGGERDSCALAVISAVETGILIPLPVSVPSATQLSVPCPLTCCPSEFSVPPSFVTTEHRLCIGADESVGEGEWEDEIKEE